MPDPPIGQHRFQPQAQITHVAIAQDRRAPGIGGEVAADARRPFRCQRQRKQPARRLGRRLDVGKDDARFGYEHVFVRVHRADARHPLDAEKDGTLTGGGDLTADQPGAAAIGHDAHMRVVARREDGRHLIGGGGGKNQPRVARPAAARFLEIARLGRAEDIGGQMPAQVGSKVRGNG